VILIVAERKRALDEAAPLRALARVRVAERSASTRATAGSAAKDVALLAMPGRCPPTTETRMRQRPRLDKPAHSSGQGYSSCWGSPSRISYHGAFEPTNMWAIGLRFGSSTRDPYGTRILPS